MRYFVMGLGAITVLLVACGSAPGEASCRQFERSLADLQEARIDNFEFLKRLGEIQEIAQAAEPQIAQAATNLYRAAHTLSDRRMEVSVEIMQNVCLEAGYMDGGVS